VVVGWTGGEGELCFKGKFIEFAERISGLREEL